MSLVSLPVCGPSRLKQWQYMVYGGDQIWHPPESLIRMSENVGTFEKWSTFGCQVHTTKDFVESSMETAISAKAIPSVEGATLRDALEPASEVRQFMRKKNWQWNRRARQGRVLEASLSPIISHSHKLPSILASVPLLPSQWPTQMQNYIGRRILENIAPVLIGKNSALWITHFHVQYISFTRYYLLLTYKQ